MDGEIYTETASRIDIGSSPRSFLFLQGPIATFFHRLGRALRARGHRVHRINLHLGDQLFWRLPATNYRGGFADWRDFIATQLEQHQISDLVLHGDRRPYHIVAAEEARRRGIRVIDTDLGYVRPDWITLEYDGMTTYSRFPRDPAAIHALALKFPEPDLAPRFHTPFWLIAALDVTYNLGLVLGRPLFPRYRYHSTCHPFVEYAGWLWSHAKRMFSGGTAPAIKRRLWQRPGSYFLVPLQLSTDFQIRAHSPFVNVREAVREIIASFARTASERRLVFVIHPLDNGLIDWNRLIARLARKHSLADRVLTLTGGTPIELLCGAAGIVTINSTVGVTALHHGIPLKVLGNAVFDVAGLSCQAPLDAFWHDPPRPDPELTAAFLRALVGATQVKGGYYVRAAQDCAIAGFVQRLEAGLFPLPPLSAAELATRQPRAAVRTVALYGVDDPIGVALARRLAGPGIRLCLIGNRAEWLEQTAADCRQRGALVETFCLGRGEDALPAELCAAIQHIAPIDTLIIRPGIIESVGRSIVEREIAGVMWIVGAFGSAMRRCRQARIVLVSGLAGQAISGDAQTIVRALKAYRTYGSALRRRLHAAGIPVATVAPNALALRTAIRWRQPQLAAISPDQFAELVERGLRRGRSGLMLPGIMTLVLHFLRVLPSRAADAVRAGATDEAPLVGKSAPGD